MSHPPVFDQPDNPKGTPWIHPDLEKVCHAAALAYLTDGVDPSVFEPWFVDLPAYTSSFKGFDVPDNTIIYRVGKDMYYVDPACPWLELGDSHILWSFFRSPYEEGSLGGMSRIFGCGSGFYFCPGLGNEVWWGLSFGCGAYEPDDRWLPVTDAFAEFVKTAYAEEIKVWYSRLANREIRHQTDEYKTLHPTPVDPFNGLHSAMKRISELEAELQALRVNTP